MYPGDQWSAPVLWSAVVSGADQSSFDQKNSSTFGLEEDTGSASVACKTAWDSNRAVFCFSRNGCYTINIRCKHRG